MCEGVWEYKVKYATYSGEKNSKRYIDGKAVSVWFGDTTIIGYHFYIGGGVKELGREGADVTLVIDFFLPTGKNGIPKTPFKLKVDTYREPPLIQNLKYPATQRSSLRKEYLQKLMNM